MSTPTTDPTIVTPAAGTAFEEWMTATNVFDAIEQTEQRCGSKTAITFIDTEPEQPVRRLGYSELLKGIARTANAFRSLGLKRGDVVAYMLPSLLETQFVLWGAATAASALPLNPLLKAEEIAALCAAVGAKALVALGPMSGTKIWDKAIRVKDLVPELTALIQVGGDGRDRSPAIHLLADLLAASPETLAFADLPALDDIAAYFHTGGTTGAPKLVAHTHRNQLAAAYGGAWAAGASTDDVIVNGLPMFHVASTIFCSLAMFVAGAEIVILSPAGFRNPRIVSEFWRIVERTGTTMVAGVPTALSVVAKVDLAGADLSRVRVNICGASLLPRSVAEQMEQLTGQPIREVYGMTECGGVICVDPVSRSRILGSAGCPAVADVAAVGMSDGYAGEVPVAYVTLRPGASVGEPELLAFAEAGISEPPAMPRRIFVLEQLPMTAVGKVYKPALRLDCTRTHLLEVLRGHPIKDLAVRDDPGRGRIVRIELAADGVIDASEARRRIADALPGYLLTLEWAAGLAHGPAATP